MTNEEIMAKDHWAIVKLETTFHEGDERSRTHPGHGYPAHSTESLRYCPYETEEELLSDWERMQPYERCTIIKAQVLTINVKTTVSAMGESD